VVSEYTNVLFTIPLLNLPAQENSYRAAVALASGV